MRQPGEAPTDAALYHAIMPSIEQSDRLFGRLVESCEKEMLPVVPPIHGYGRAAMPSLGPQRCMDPGTSKHEAARLAIKVRPWGLLANEAVMEERQWTAMLSALMNALGPQRLIAAVKTMGQSEEVKQVIGARRFRKAVGLLSGLGEDPWACVSAV